MPCTRLKDRRQRRRPVSAGHRPEADRHHHVAGALLRELVDHAGTTRALANDHLARPIPRRNLPVLPRVGTPANPYAQPPMRPPTKTTNYSA